MLRDVLQDFDHKLLNHFWYEDIEFARPVARERMQDTKEWLSHQIMPTFWKAWDKGGSDLFIWFTEELLKQVNERSE
jgi:6-pyruvoyl-tetrahydropterin synthase